MFLSKFCFIEVKVNESRYTQCGLTPQFSKSIEKNIEKRSILAKLLIDKSKYYHNQLRKAFRAIYRDSLILILNLIQAVFKVLEIGSVIFFTSIFYASFSYA